MEWRNEDWLNNEGLDWMIGCKAWSVAVCCRADDDWRKERRDEKRWEEPFNKWSSRIIVL